MKRYTFRSLINENIKLTVSAESQEEAKSYAEYDLDELDSTGEWAGYKGTSLVLKRGTMLDDVHPLIDDYRVTEVEYVSLEYKTNCR